MPEIRINAKPCSKCGHRNVTGEARICERCGTSLTLDRRVRFLVLGSMILVFLVAGGVFAVNVFGDSAKGLAAPSPEASSASADPETLSGDNEVAPLSLDDNPPPTPVSRTGKNETSADEVRTDAPRSANYQNLVAGAEILMNDLPLRVRSGPLQNFESEDFEALVETLMTGSYQDREIIIVGLSEEIGTPFMALNRAEFAKTVLTEKYQISNPIHAVGFGPEESGNLKDPKVEIWIK